MDKDLRDSLKNCGLKTKKERENLVDTLKMNGFEIIAIEDLNSIKNDAVELDKLYAYGVTDWEGYEIALKNM